MPLILPRKVLDELIPWSEKCYPYEGCGLLLGHFEAGGAKLARRFVPLSNVLHDRTQAPPSHVLEAASASLGSRVHSRGQFEFVMDPREFNQAVLSGEKENLDVVGILHTHPDHPARPSPVDASQPLLAGWSNIIVKVDKGRFVEAKSWVREEESQPFQEEPISVQ
jgi:proteasome lid subunit RPN8/RPN11